MGLVARLGGAEIAGLSVDEMEQYAHGTHVYLASQGWPAGVGYVRQEGRVERCVDA